MESQLNLQGKSENVGETAGLFPTGKSISLQKGILRSSQAKLHMNVSNRSATSKKSLETQLLKSILCAVVEQVNAG